MRGLIVVLWRAGLRISEALSLAESDLDRARGAVLVRRGKAGKRREVGMDPWAWDQLAPRRRARRPEKLTDVVGLYLNPPEKALVLCVDGKSQIQALDRTQASLPMKRGRVGTMTHDYKRKRHHDVVRRTGRA
jgi:integrase